jgi:hypothetical protein
MGNDLRGRGGSPDDPFLREMYRDPKRLARIHAFITVGMVLFWAFLVLGLIVFAAFALL